MDIYTVLRRIRVEKGLSQQNLADDLGLSLTGYAKIERGETELTISRLEQLSKYYQMNILDFFKLIHPSNMPPEEESAIKKEINYLKQIHQLLHDKIAYLEKNHLSK
jgi:transcriptional regulator with XRE-family HTH domain